MATSGKKIRAQRTKAVPSGFSCAHCRGYKGEHTHKCPIFQREFVDTLAFLIRCDESDLAQTDTARAITDRKARNKLLARIERRKKTLARLDGTSYNRVDNDRKRALDALTRLERIGTWGR